MTTKSRARIGFVGVGSMGQCAHLRNYASIAECDVVAISEPRARLARKVADRYGVARVYTDAETMLAAESLDGIVASQQFDRHGSIVKPLYRFGIPIFTEKPLASSVEVGVEMLTSLEAGGSWHMVGYNKRCDPATEAAKAEIDRLKATSELGRLRYVRVSMPPGDWVAAGFRDLISTDESPPSVPPDVAAADMSEDQFRDYVSFVNYYIHQVNLMRHLLGEPYRVTHADSSGVLMVIESDSGVTGTIELGPYRTTVDWQESALVAFDSGNVRLSLPAPLASNRPGTVEFLRDPGSGATPETVSPHLPWSHSMYRQAERFVEAVRGGRKPPCEAREALEDLQIARDVLRLRGAR